MPSSANAPHDAPRLPREVVARLSRPSRWAGPVHVALEWAGILGAAALASAGDSFLWAVPAAVWIGARQHALLALAHEAAHGRLLAELLGPHRGALAAECLVAWPMGVSIRSYRRVHLAHHRHLSTDGDPDWVRNRPDLWGQSASLWGRLRHLLGLHSGQRALFALFTGKGFTGNGFTGKGFAGKGESRNSERRDRNHAWGRLAFYCIAAVVITLMGGWREVALFWLAPLFLWTPWLLRLRGISEHWAIPAKATLSDTRTLLLSPIGRTLFLPKNMGYHVEHHLYPSVPFHQLPALHAELNESKGYADAAHVTRGVPALIAELMHY